MPSDTPALSPEMSRSRRRDREAPKRCFLTALKLLVQIGKDRPEIRAAPAAHSERAEQLLHIFLACELMDAPDLCIALKQRDAKGGEALQNAHQLAQKVLHHLAAAGAGGVQRDRKGEPVTVFAQLVRFNDGDIAELLQPDMIPDAVDGIGIDRRDLVRTQEAAEEGGVAHAARLDLAVYRRKAAGINSGI